MAYNYEDDEYEGKRKHFNLRYVFAKRIYGDMSSADVSDLTLTTPAPPPDPDESGSGGGGVTPPAVICYAEAVNYSVENGIVSVTNNTGHPVTAVISITDINAEKSFPILANTGTRSVEIGADFIGTVTYDLFTQFKTALSNTAPTIDFYKSNFVDYTITLAGITVSGLNSESEPCSATSSINQANRAHYRINAVEEAIVTPEFECGDATLPAESLESDFGKALFVYYKVKASAEPKIDYTASTLKMPMTMELYTDFLKVYSSGFNYQDGIQGEAEFLGNATLPYIIHRRTVAKEDAIGQYTAFCPELLTRIHSVVSPEIKVDLDLSGIEKIPYNTLPHAVKHLNYDYDGAFYDGTFFVKELDKYTTLEVTAATLNYDGTMSKYPRSNVSPSERGVIAEILPDTPLTDYVYYYQNTNSLEYLFTVNGEAREYGADEIVTTEYPTIVVLGEEYVKLLPTHDSLESCNVVIKTASVMRSPRAINQIVIGEF